MPGVTKETGSSSRYVGRAGEHAVASQLFLRGVNVFFPAIDSGVDLWCDNGCRIQVKTSHLCAFDSHRKTYPEGIYQFYFPAFKSVAMNSTNSRRATRKGVDEYADVVVCWGVEQNRYWVIPATTLKRTQMLRLGPSNSRLFEKDLPEMKAMVEMGMSQVEIGKYFGIKQSSVGKRLQKDGTRRHQAAIRDAARQFENAWSVITEFDPAARGQKVFEPEAAQQEVI